eukprot:scaffold10853_cov54-Phaeocystis_antarctica.AAC.3
MLPSEPAAISLLTCCECRTQLSVRGVERVARCSGAGLAAPRKVYRGIHTPSPECGDRSPVFVAPGAQKFGEESPISRLSAASARRRARCYLVINPGPSAQRQRVVAHVVT